MLCSWGAGQRLRIYARTRQKLSFHWSESEGPALKCSAGFSKHSMSWPGRPCLSSKESGPGPQAPRPPLPVPPVSPTEEPSCRLATSLHGPPPFTHTWICPPGPGLRIKSRGLPDRSQLPPSRAGTWPSLARASPPPRPQTVSCL